MLAVQHLAAKDEAVEFAHVLILDRIA
jgi:hypothetical protein